MTEWCLVSTHHCWYFDALNGFFVSAAAALLVGVLAWAVERVIK